MKAQKLYGLAKRINAKLYEYPSLLSNEEKQVLYKEYFLLIKKSAYSGNVEAMYDMAQQIENISYLGIPNPLYNPTRCVYWYRKACINMHAEACNNLSNFYALGEGCKQDFTMALNLLKKAADLGSTLGKKNYNMKLRDLAKTGGYLRSSV